MPLQLAGYIGSVSLLEKVLEVVAALRQANPDLVYGMCCIHCCLLAEAMPTCRAAKVRYSQADGTQQLIMIMALLQCVIL